MQTENDDLNQLKDNLSRKELELQSQYCQMGKAMLDLADSEQRHIDRTIEEIIELRKQLIKAQSQIQCTNCMAYNPQDSNYCSHCGQILDDNIEGDNDE